nr:SDR family NAD(P)-dependent oxidoreductase [uncultured Lichenicoccus sp.]
MAQENTAQDTPVWLITGCSTGFGRELAKLVLARGWRAVVTARDAAKVADLIEGHEDRALALALDVDQPTQVRSVVRQAEARFGAADVLVNNAGYGYLAAIVRTRLSCLSAWPGAPGPHLQPGRLRRPAASRAACRQSRP